MKKYGYSDYQTQMKQETKDKVQAAIDELTSEGAIVSKPRLVEKTGLSRTLFDKPHVLEILQDNEVCEFSQKVVATKKDDSSYSILSKKFLRLDKENESLKSKVEQLNQKCSKYQSLYLETKEEYELLLGEWHLLLKKAKLKGLYVEGYME